MIKDSGERRKFESGAVRDIQEGKGRCDLLPLSVLGKFYEMCDSWDCVAAFNYINNFVETGDIGFLYDVLFYCKPKTFDCYETVFLEVAKHFEEGCKKYGENNWQKGIPAHCYIDSAVRHFLKYIRDDEDEPHDKAFVWNIMCCIWTCEHYPELNDYNRGEKE